jgi:hypothetical protein
MDKELRVKIKIDSETAKLDTLNSKINNTSKGFNNADSMASAFTSKLDTLNSKINNTSKNFNNADSMASSFTSKLDALNSKINNTSKSSNEAGSMASSFLSKIGSVAVPIAGMYLVVKAIEAVKDAIVYTTTAGIDFNKQLETMQIGITSLIAVSSQNTTTTGQVLSAQEKYKISSYQTLEVMQMLKKANLETSATLGELTSGFQSALTPARNAGFTMNQTVEYTKLMTQAAGAMGVPMNQLSQELKSVVSGTIDLNSVVASNLGITNEQIKKHKTQGDLFDFLKTKLADFAVAGTDVSNSFAGSVSNMEDSFLEFASVITKPLFDELKAEAISTATLFKSLTTVVQDFYDTLKSPFELNSIDQLNKKAIDVTAKIANKQEQISNAFGFNKGKYEAELRALNQEMNGVVQQYGILNERDKQSSGLAAKKEIIEISSELKKLIDPVDVIKEKYSKLRDELEKGGKATSDNLSKLSNAESKEIADVNKKERDELKKTTDEIDKTNKALLDISQIGMSEYDKGLISITEKTNEWEKAGVSQNDILIAQNKLLDELKSKTLYEAQKEDLSYFERKIQLMDDSIGKETELQGIAYTNKILEIENSTKSIAEKDKLIAKETELFNLTVQHMTYKDNLEFQNTMSNFYDDMLDSQLALNNAVYDFGSGFDGVSSKIGAVSKSIAAMSSLELTNKKEASKLDKKYIEQFNKYAGDVEKTKALEQQYTKDTAILNEQNIQAQLAGYSNIAGAMSGMFEQGSREAASFQLVESGLALATGIRAILTQGSGDPYTAFARMAAMTATVSSMLGNIGIAFDMNKTTTSSDAFSAMTANNGSGSVLGDSKASTKSITNALSTLEDFAKPEYQTLLSMNNYLETIANNIGGVTSLLIQSGGFAFGEGYSGFDTGYKNNIGLNTTAAGLLGGAGAIAGMGLLGTGFGAMGALSVLGPAGLAIAGIDQLLLGGAITNILGGLVNSVLGGLFGKTKVYQSLTDSGIYFADTLLTSAIDQFNGQAYQTISTTVTKKSWFSKSSSTSISTYFDALDSETERQFSLVLDNLYNTVLVAGTALDSATVDTANLLANFTVSLGKISLKDKTGDQIQEALTSIFGKVGDDIAKTAFPLLSGFQKVGEGMFETLTRVATGMENAEFYIGRLGNKFTDVIYTSITNQQGDVGFEALLQSIEKFDEATYGANNNLVKIIDSLDSTAEELYTVYTVLDELRDKLIFLGQSSAGISSSMIYGAGGVDSLSGGFNSYFENFLSESEQLAFKTSQLSESFTNLGIQMPTTNKAFKTLLSGLDLTSESGQELYGRLIILSDSFAEISSLRVNALQDELDITTASISNIQEISTSLDSVITSLRSGLDSSSTNLLEKFNRSMATSLLLSNADDYTALANSVKESISYSSALNNSDYFGTLRDMQFAQSVAANNFENININLEDELSVLQKIANNTNEMIDALSNLTSAVKTLNDSNSTIATNTADSRIAI